jgi:hypothetical protein
MSTSRLLTTWRGMPQNLLTPILRRLLASRGDFPPNWWSLWATANVQLLMSLLVMH